jgi:hypothetical protein
MSGWNASWSIPSHSPCFAWDLLGQDVQASELEIQTGPNQPIRLGKHRWKTVGGSDRESQKEDIRKDSLNEGLEAGERRSSRSKLKQEPVIHTSNPSYLRG